MYQLFSLRNVDNQDSQKKNPGGLHGGVAAWGCKQERKTEGKKRYGEQSEGKRKRNDTKGQSDRHADNKKEEREREKQNVKKQNTSGVQQNNM